MLKRDDCFDGPRRAAMRSYFADKYEPLEADIAAMPRAPFKWGIAMPSVRGLNPQRLLIYATLFRIWVERLMPPVWWVLQK